MLAEPTSEFREALRTQIERPQEKLEPFTHALAALARAAKDAGGTAEQLVILVKREIEAVEKQAGVNASAAHEALRNRVVTSAIKAYYMQ